MFFVFIKMVNKYYLKNKEKLQKEAHERYQNLSEEEKEKKGHNHCEQNNNLSEEKQIKLNIWKIII